MHDPKFEQEVQRRMHDLEFVPSESVWTVIQQGIAPQERRRSVAVFWWLFPGLLLLTGGIVMYRHSASTNGVAAKAAAHAVPPGGGDEGNKKETEQAIATNRTAGQAAVTNQTRGLASRRGLTAQEVVVRGAKEQGTTEQGTTVRGTTEQGSPEEGTAQGTAMQGATAKRAMVGRFDPGLIGGMTLRRGVSAPMIHGPVNTAVNGIRAPKHPWYMGFAGGGGGSSIYSRGGDALVTGSSSNRYYSMAAYNPSSPTGLQQNLQSVSQLNAAASKRNGTDVRPNYSYWAGIYGEKRLSARWSLDIGLNLHYYSVRFQTETQVNTYAPSSASLLVASPVTYTANAANSYASSNEQTYINSYYFVEVPVAAQWKLNHSRSLPLFWRGGAVLSYFMSSNGLYYDNYSGEYKSDNGVMRRTQASVHTGLVVGLPVGAVQIQVGPEVQYALTSMLRSGSGGGHMVYGGVRVALMR